jgi:mono/diheme cytochrome c family protein
MKVQINIGAIASLVALTASGCAREPEGQFVANAAVQKLSPKLQSEIQTTLAQYCGTPSTLRDLTNPKASSAQLRLGAAVYGKHCKQCHGVSGDGNGPAAQYLLPRPRDYRPGVFKFTSTTYGSKPLREDLTRTVKRGIAGTSMPSFRLLPQEEIDAVIEYVLALTHRGELELQLASIAEVEEQIERAAISESIDVLKNRWKDAPSQIVYPVTPMPVFSRESVADGKQAFLTKGCAQCHGEDGRGQMKENIGVDSWGRPTKAADLTSGMLRGGTEALDVYRHVNAGINGTPMPSFSGALQQEPELMWKLTAYVLNLVNERRTGSIPEAGLLKPLPGVETKSQSAKSSEGASGAPAVAVSEAKTKGRSQ